MECTAAWRTIICQMLRYLEYGLFDVLAQSLGHAAHVVRHLVHALRQAVGEGLDGVGHVTHGAPQGVHEGVHLFPEGEGEGRHAQNLVVNLNVITYKVSLVERLYHFIIQLFYS